MEILGTRLPHVGSLLASVHSVSRSILLKVSLASIISHRDKLCIKFKLQHSSRELREISQSENK